MKLIISSSLIAICILAGIYLAVVLPAPKFSVSAQPTGSTIVIDQLITSQTGFIYVEGSKYGKIQPGIIGTYLSPLKPGTYTNISIPLKLSEDKLTQVGKVRITFVPDRNENEVFEPGDYVENPFYKIFATATINRW